MNKVTNIEQAVSYIKSGDTVHIGGFGGFGMPGNLIREIANQNIGDLTVVSEGFSALFRPQLKGVGYLTEKKLVKKAIISFVGGDPEIEAMVDSGEIELEFVPQGTLVERIRAAGTGIAGFYTPTGVGTIVEEGKETKEFNGKKYLLELPLPANVAIVKAYIADTMGNAVFKYTGSNFNIAMAMAADVVILEAEKIVEAGEIVPDRVQLPGVFVDYVVLAEEVEV